MRVGYDEIDGMIWKFGIRGVHKSGKRSVELNMEKGDWESLFLEKQWFVSTQGKGLHMEIWMTDY